MPILCVKATIFVSLSMQGSAEVFLMTLKDSPRSLALKESLLDDTPDLRYIPMLHYWSSSSGIRCAIYPIVGRWHICRLACSVSSFPPYCYHDFGVILPRSGGKAFCSTKRFLWHKNTPCPAFGPYAKRAAQLLNFQFGGKAMMTLQSACNKGCLNFFPRFPAVSLRGRE